MYNNVDKEEVYKKLMRKAESIKTEFKENKFNYDQYKLKNIIKENLKDLKKKNIFADENKYEDYINEKIDINDYLSKDGEEEYSDRTIQIESKDLTMIDELNKLELNAISKAKELENQINYINNKRIDLLAKDFKERLIEDSQIEFLNFNMILQDEFKSALKNINEEHSEKLTKIEKLQNKVIELEKFIKEINQEIREEKIEVNSGFEKYLNHMDNEKNKAIDKYKVDMNIFIENRVKIFRSHLESKIKK